MESLLFPSVDRARSSLLIVPCTPPMGGILFSSLLFGALYKYKQFAALDKPASPHSHNRAPVVTGVNRRESTARKSLAMCSALPSRPS